MIYVETFKEEAYSVKLRVTLIRDLGNGLNPCNAYLTNLGLETLHLKMGRHLYNALNLAKWNQWHIKLWNKRWNRRYKRHNYRF